MHALTGFAIGLAAGGVLGAMAVALIIGGTR